MKSRSPSRAIVYERRSDDGQEASLRQQFDWATATSQRIGVPFRGTYADIEDMQRRRLHHHQDLYLDDAVSGGDLSRPGFRQFLRDAIADPTVSHVYVFKRDRLGRPQALLEMMRLEQELIASGVTLVTHDKTYTAEDLKANESSTSSEASSSTRNTVDFHPGSATGSSSCSRAWRHAA